MHRVLVFAVPLVGSLVATLAVNTATASERQGATNSAASRLTCQLAGGTPAFPDLVIANLGNKALEAGRTVDVAFSSGIKFAVNLQQTVPPGAYLQTLLPDTVNGVPTGTCVAAAGS